VGTGKTRDIKVRKPIQGELSEMSRINIIFSPRVPITVHNPIVPLILTVLLVQSLVQYIYRYNSLQFRDIKNDVNTRISSTSRFVPGTKCDNPGKARIIPFFFLDRYSNS
jgi:hypothetical protein